MIDGQEPKMDEQGMWRAVEARDARADGAFVFAVSSTGIYCRPGCAARRPKRENVRFFDAPALAEQAGFRACLRCRPKAAQPDPQVARARRACRLIDTALEDGAERLPTLEELAAKVGGSPHHLQRVFKRVVGVSPAQYADARRLARLKRSLKQGEEVTHALYDAGYGASSRLYERAPGQLGMTPATYARGGRGARIAWAAADSPLGRLLVAATEKGVCFLCLGDDEAELADALRREFPDAELVRDDAVLAQWLRRALAYLEGRAPHLDLPLDVRATAFQWQVWRALAAIPRGETRTYGAIAADLGRPAAARAVGRACGLNPVALVVPCHRAVGGDGTLTGYRWGIERKRRLLDLEKTKKA
jgi:AraC family transcriptional regulator of adaptative response/methylated-DNA-[protein]-cysteine methyltransferase